MTRMVVGRPGTKFDFGHQRRLDIRTWRAASLLRRSAKGLAGDRTRSSPPTEVSGDRSGEPVPRRPGMHQVAAGIVAEHEGADGMAGTWTTGRSCSMTNSCCLEHLEFHPAFAAARTVRAVAQRSFEIMPSRLRRQA